MIQLHDAEVRDSIRTRIRSLSAGTRPRWGRMSSAQMLWHCSQVLKTSLGEAEVAPRRPPFPVPVLKFMLFRLPWPHNAPTAPEYKAGVAHDFETERMRCLGLIDRFVARKREEGGWSRAVFGAITGREWSCLHARHLDHHLKQFGV
jgi:hypothetical protein